MKQQNTFEEIVKKTFWLLFFVMLTPGAHAQWLHDNQYGFQIRVPAGWSKASHMDGADKVYDFYSAGENAALQIRVFKTDPRITVDLLIQTYEQNMLPKGTKRESLQSHTTKNGIPGKIGIYSFYFNHNLVNMMAFYTVHEGKGYVMTGMVPANITAKEQREADALQQMISTFRIDKTRPGSTPVSSGYAASTDRNAIAGTYRLVSRSDNNKTLNYWHITLNRDGTYVDRHQFKGNPPYTTGEEGTWRITGNTPVQVTLYNKYHRNLQTVYEYRNQQLIRKSGNGTFIFKK